MQNHVSEFVTVDSFQAKLGKDEDVAVVKFQTDNKSVLYSTTYKGEDIVIFKFYSKMTLLYN